MPAPDASFLADPAPPDLGPPSVALALLEERIAQHLGVAPEQVLATLGTSGALHAVASHWFRPGSRVAVEWPSYEALRALPDLFGAESRALERRADRDWSLDPARVRAALGSARPGHVFLSTPHNPTGAVLDPETLGAVAEQAARVGGVLVADEVYMEFAPPTRRFHACQLAPNAVTLGSLTKAYGLGALRVGWIALGSGLVEERAGLEDERFLDHVDPPSVASRLALKAFEHLDHLHAASSEIERESKPLLARWMLETPGVEGYLPPLGLIAFPRLVGIEDTREFARFLSRQFELDVVPGEYFGLPGHVRLGFGLPAAELDAALARLTQGLAAYRATPGGSGAQGAGA